MRSPAPRASRNALQGLLSVPVPEVCQTKSHLPSLRFSALFRGRVKNPKSSIPSINKAFCNVLFAIGDQCAHKTIGGGQRQEAGLVTNEGQGYSRRHTRACCGR